MTVRPHILIASTTWWPTAARLAIAFTDAGADVTVVCPKGNAARVLKRLRGTYSYSPLAPRQALVRAILGSRPDIIVPTDDRTVEHLQALHRASSSADPDDVAMRALIVRSLGAPEGYALVGTRHRLLEAVRADGIAVPAGVALSSEADVEAWCNATQAPWVIKAEASWGGSGVVVADTISDAKAAFRQLACPLPARKAFRILLVDRDPFPFRQFLRRERRTITGQSHVTGKQATLMVACWQGRVLGTVGAEVLSTQGATGAATVLRLLENSRLDAVAALVAQRFGLSGFFGLDFIIEQETSIPYLIELNPRATQLGHLGNGRSSLATLLLSALNQDTTNLAAPKQDRVVALFPQALRFVTDGGLWSMADLDAPWSEPALVRELLRQPWTKRSLLARLEARMRNNAAYGTSVDRRMLDQVNAMIGIHARVDDANYAASFMLNGREPDEPNQWQAVSRRTRDLVSEQTPVMD